MTPEMAIAQAINQLRQEFEMKRRDDQRAIQEAIVRLQDNQSKWQAWADRVSEVIGPLEDTPKLSLNLRPRI